MEDLSVDEIIHQLTYLPLKDARALCKTNKKIHSICSSRKYENNWKQMIEDTYSQTSFYQELKRVKPNLRYNFRLYVDLTKMLPYNIQATIYSQQGDEDSYAKTIKKSEKTIKKSEKTMVHQLA